MAVKILQSKKIAEGLISVIFEIVPDISLPKKRLKLKIPNQKKSQPQKAPE